jgi:hypothetical protein
MDQMFDIADAVIFLLPLALAVITLSIFTRFVVR